MFTSPFWIVCVVWALTVSTIYLFNWLCLGTALHSPASIPSFFNFATYDDVEVINEAHFVVNFLVIVDELHTGCIMMSACWIPVLLGVIGLHVSRAVREHYFCFFQLQASGNVTMDTVKKIGETGVTYISRYEYILIYLDGLLLYLFAVLIKMNIPMIFNPISCISCFFFLQWSINTFSEGARHISQDRHRTGSSSRKAYKSRLTQEVSSVPPCITWPSFFPSSLS
jgi:hypothetical protein